MKTIREWLETLPPDARDRALVNVRAQGRERKLGDQEQDLRNAVLVAFIWRKTPEGFWYWNDVSKGRTPNLKTESKC